MPLIGKGDTINAFLLKSGQTINSVKFAAVKFSNMAAQHLPTEPEKHSRSLNRTVVIMRNRAGKFTASFQWGIRILLNSVLQDQFIAEDGGDFLAMKHTKESMTYVFDVTTELAIPYEQIMDLPR